jgi:hypothetical protein
MHAGLPSGCPRKSVTSPPSIRPSASIWFWTGQLNLGHHSRPLALAATALGVGALAALLFPLTWGASSFPALFALPLSVPALRTPGLGRLLAVLALLINAALTVLLVLIWFV